MKSWNGHLGVLVVVLKMLGDLGDLGNLTLELSRVVMTLFLPQSTEVGSHSGSILRLLRR